MRKPTALSRWDAAVAAYLSSRHALGRAFLNEEVALRHIRAFLERCRAKDLDQSLFDQWRREFCDRSASTRVIRERAVYNFCRYRRRTEPSVFVPDPFALTRSRPYALPTLIEHTQVRELLRYVSRRGSTRQCRQRAAVLRLAIVLLYTAGLRRGELARLSMDDVDYRAGVLRIRESKFHKSRWVPLSQSAARELRRYLALRRLVDACPTTNAPLLCSARGKRYSLDGLANSIRRAMVDSGIWAARPRIHDFRHSFAVAALARWYRSNADVQSQLPRLALYMGHVSIASTAHYLRYMPSVVTLAGRRFERACGALIQGGGDS
jgi:integrase